MLKKTQYGALILALTVAGSFLPARGQGQEPDTKLGVGVPAEERANKDDPSGKRPPDGSGTSKTPHLDEIVVTATRIDDKMKNVPVNVEIIKSKEIEETGDVSLADVLGKRVTGHYHRYPGVAAAAGLRGFRTETTGDDIKGHVLVLIDGHRLGTGNLAKIPPEMIERVEVIKGPASSLYGSAAMGGVINIITKKGKGPLTAGIKGEAGSFNYQKGSLWSGGNVTDLMSYYVFGSRMTIGEYRTDDYGTVHNTKERDWHTGGNITLYPATNQSLRAGFSYSEMISQYPSWQWDRDTWYTYYYTEYDEYNGQYTNKTRGHGDLEYNLRLLDDHLRWRSMVYYLRDYNKTNYGDVRKSKRPEDSSSTYNDETWGTDQQFTVIVPYNKLIFGYTGEYLKKTSRAHDAGKPAVPLTPSMDYRTNSGYAEDSVMLLDERLIFVLGGRYDSFEVKTVRSTTGTYDSFNNASRTFQHFSPRGGIVIRPIDWFRVRGNIGESFRAPSADELSAEYEYTTSGAWGPSTSRYLGNRDLKPESGYAREAGFDLSFETVSLGGTYFFTHTNNMIDQNRNEKVRYKGKDWTTWENIGAIEIEGYEAYVSLLVGKMLKSPVDVDIASSATFNRRYQNMITGEDLKYISDEEVKSSLRLAYKGASITLFHVYVGTQLIDDWVAYQEDYKPATMIKEPFYYWDLTFQWQINKHVKVEGGIFNLTNRDYEWVHTYPAPERNFKLGVTGTI